jgi:steroid 5-alpha reductase family enzyme
MIFFYVYHPFLLGITTRKLNINPQNNLSQWKFICLVIVTFFLMSEVTPNSQLKRNCHNIPPMVCEVELNSNLPQSLV